jgi:predicted nucleotidyltransferase
MNKLLIYLAKHKDKKHTMHSLSSKLQIPYATFYRKVNQIQNLLKIESVGNSKILSINKYEPEVYARLILGSIKEKEEYLERKPFLKLLLKENTDDIILLFGSYAKDEERTNSDIDLIIVNSTGEKTISFKKEETILAKEINALFFTKQEFKEMLKSPGENVGKQAYKNHILLNNPKEFWEIVYDEL